MSPSLDASSAPQSNTNQLSQSLSYNEGSKFCFNQKTVFSFSHTLISYMKDNSVNADKAFQASSGQTGSYSNATQGHQSEFNATNKKVDNQLIHDSLIKDKIPYPCNAKRYRNPFIPILLKKFSSIFEQKFFHYNKSYILHQGNIINKLKQTDNSPLPYVVIQFTAQDNQIHEYQFSPSIFQTLRTIYRYSKIEFDIKYVVRNWMQIVNMFDMTSILHFVPIFKDLLLFKNFFNSIEQNDQISCITMIQSENDRNQQQNQINQSFSLEELLGQTQQIWKEQISKSKQSFSSRDIFDKNIENISNQVPQSKQTIEQNIIQPLDTTSINYESSYSTQILQFKQHLNQQILQDTESIQSNNDNQKKKFELQQQIEYKDWLQSLSNQIKMSNQGEHNIKSLQMLLVGEGNVVDKRLIQVTNETKIKYGIPLNLKLYTLDLSYWSLTVLGFLLFQKQKGWDNIFATETRFSQIDDIFFNTIYCRSRIFPNLRQINLGTYSLQQKIEYNSITSITMEHLQTLKKNTKIKYINLKFNPLTELSIQTIQAFMMNNKQIKIQYNNFYNFYISKYGAQEQFPLDWYEMDWKIKNQVMKKKK